MPVHVLTRFESPEEQQTLLTADFFVLFYQIIMCIGLVGALLCVCVYSWCCDHDCAHLCSVGYLPLSTE